MSLGCLWSEGHSRWPAVGAGGVHEALQFQGGDDVRALGVLELVELLHGDGVEPCGHHNGAVLPREDLVLLVIFNGPHGAVLLAQAAFARFELDAGGGVDHRQLGHGLGKGDVDGGAGVHPQVELIFGLAGGAFLGAQAAAGALGGVYIARLLADIHLEAAHKAETFSTSQ